MDYLKKMPFTIVFIDQKGHDYDDSSQDLIAYITRHPMAIPRLHQPKFAYNLLEMAPYQCGMRVVRRPADRLIKRELIYVIRNAMFKNDVAMWAFINDPNNISIVQ